MNLLSRARCAPLRADHVYSREYPHDARCRVLTVRRLFHPLRGDLYSFARTDEDAYARVMRIRFGFSDDPVYRAEPRTFRLEKIARRTKLQYRFTKRFACWKNVRDIGERE